MRRKHMDAPIGKVDLLEDNLFRRGRERPRKTLAEVISSDLIINGFMENIVFNKAIDPCSQPHLMR